MAEVAKHPWLTQRNGVFYVRAPVPRDILVTFGKAEVTYSLKTKDREVADRVINDHAKRVADRFEQHRRAGPNEAGAGTRTVASLVRSTLSPPPAAPHAS